MLFIILFEFTIMNLLIPLFVSFFFSFQSGWILFSVALAAFFNGNADATAFRFDRVLWRHIFKGKLLDWYEGKYYNKLHKWYIHPIFWDGWHFFKNGAIGSFLLAIYRGIMIKINWTEAIILLIFSAVLFAIIHDEWLGLNNDIPVKNQSKFYTILRDNNEVE